ncbi:hypothetical protein PAHA111176_20975 [Parendozoicomonas haliclonae]|uniref:Uncharacterized protein n=2 Tax=Parendozoicomonas haliclonae TaxID=1960125 RepID=A0A1X7ARL1_9GAMM|nr:hypothetical protein EHSB41UT_04555 [Parendozoicomonas haliclonae]
MEVELHPEPEQEPEVKASSKKKKKKEKGSKQSSDTKPTATSQRGRFKVPKVLTNAFNSMTLSRQKSTTPSENEETVLPSESSDSESDSKLQHIQKEKDLTAVSHSRPTRRAPPPPPKTVNPTESQDQNPSLTVSPQPVSMMASSKPVIKAKPTALKQAPPVTLDIPAIITKLQHIPQRLLPRLVYHDFNNTILLLEMAEEEMEAEELDIDHDSYMKLLRSSVLYSSYLHFLETEFKNAGATIPVSRLGQDFKTLSQVINHLLTYSNDSDYDQMAKGLLSTELYSQPLSETMPNTNVFRVDELYIGIARHDFIRDHFNAIARLHNDFVRFLHLNPEKKAQSLGHRLKKHILIELRQEAGDSFTGFDTPMVWRGDSTFPEVPPDGPGKDNYFIYAYPSEDTEIAWQYLIEMSFARISKGEAVFDVLADFRLMADILIQPFHQEAFNTINLVTSLLALTMGEHPVLLMDKELDKVSLSTLKHPEVLSKRLNNGALKVAHLAKNLREMGPTTRLAHPKHGKAVDTLVVATLKANDQDIEDIIEGLLPQYYDSVLKRAAKIGELTSPEPMEVTQ